MDIGDDVLGVQDRSVRIYCKFGLKTAVRNVGEVAA